MPLLIILKARSLFVYSVMKCVRTVPGTLRSRLTTPRRRNGWKCLFILCRSAIAVRF
ncbi:MAG TPA: hypothetical protein ACFCUY_12785 [Xenococcaceae cyanobacterium]